MNEKQRKFFDLPFEKREKVFFKMFPKGKQLKKKLLAVGGDSIVWLPMESNIDALINEGRSFSLDKRKKVKGEVNRCHDNTAKLFLEKDVGIATGYALNKNRWIQHSWGFDGKRVVETTCLFDAYYGIVLAGLEITKFVIGQLRDEIMNLPREQALKLPLPQNINELIS